MDDEKEKVVEQEEKKLAAGGYDFEIKGQRIMTLLSVITTIGDKFIANKELKDRVINKATGMLEKELENF